MMLNNNQRAFIALVKAGLWEQNVRFSQFDRIDYSEILNLAEEQSVTGLVAEGLEHVVDVKVPKEDVLQFVGQALQLEHRNQAMNHFISGIVNKLSHAGIYTLLVKGQGIAQCYERPLWRVCGDVDLYLSKSNYQEAKVYLKKIAQNVDPEDEERMHLGMTIDRWIVELHGSMHSNLSKRVNRGLDEVHKSIFYGGEVRSWNNDGVTVFLPSVDNDLIIIFTHILQHFFVEGIGLRQICDWCRLLWTYREIINEKLLEKRLIQMGLMDKWRVFGAMAVDYLGMPCDAMPFYTNNRFLSRKGDRITVLILDTGNFGHNRDMSYKVKDSFAVRLAKSFKRRNKDAVRQFMIFPLDAIRMWWKMFLTGMGVAFNVK